MGGKGGKNFELLTISASVNLFVIMFLSGGKLFAMRNTALRTIFAGIVSVVNKPTILLVP